MHNLFEEPFCLVICSMCFLQVDLCFYILIDFDYLFVTFNAASLFNNLIIYLYWLFIYRYENQLENFCKFMDPLIDSSPPETHQGVSSFNARLKHKLQKSEFWAHCLHQSVTMGQQGLV